MGEAMVTGRMAPGKKRRGGLVLQREGLTASQAINRMYDKLIENGDASIPSPNPYSTAHPMPTMRRPRR